MESGKPCLPPEPARILSVSPIVFEPGDTVAMVWARGVVLFEGGAGASIYTIQLVPDDVGWAVADIDRVGWEEIGPARR